MKSQYPVVELGRHVRQISQRNRSDVEREVFSVTNSEGFTRSTEYFSKEVFSKDVSNYKVVNPGQFAGSMPFSVELDFINNGGRSREQAGQPERRDWLADV